MISLRERAGALAERPFRLLWLGQTTSAIGDTMIGVALVFGVFQIGGGGTELGLVLASLTIGRSAFVLVGGVWADRLPRRLVMLTCDVIRGVVDAFIAVALLTGAMEVWMFVVTSFVFGAASAFFAPAATGLVPQTISAGRLQQANALLALSRSTVQIAGPAVSGVIVAVAEPGWVFAIDALSFVGSAAFLAVLPIAAGDRPPRQTFLTDFAEGARAALSRGWLRAGLSLVAVTILGIGISLVLGPASRERLRDSPQQSRADAPLRRRRLAQVGVLRLPRDDPRRPAPARSARRGRARAEARSPPGAARRGWPGARRAPA